MEITEEKADKLDTIFYFQKLFDAEVAAKHGDRMDFSDEEWIQKKSLALFCEMSEVLNEVNYKWWKNKKPVDRSALEEELVDVLHFFVSICLSAGISSDGLFDAYMKKNRENFDRQNGLSVKKGYVAGEDNA